MCKDNTDLNWNFKTLYCKYKTTVALFEESNNALNCKDESFHKCVENIEVQPKLEIILIRFEQIWKKDMVILWLYHNMIV